MYITGMNYHKNTNFVIIINKCSLILLTIYYAKEATHYAREATHYLVNDKRG